MEKIQDTVKKVMGLLATRQKGLPDTDPQVLLKNILTTKELRHIKIHYFKRGILGINVDSSAWLYHFSLKKDKLLTRMGKINNSISDIWFRLGGVE